MRKSEREDNSTHGKFFFKAGQREVTPSLQQTFKVNNRELVRIQETTMRKTEFY